MDKGISREELTEIRERCELYHDKRADEDIKLLLSEIDRLTDLREQIKIYFNQLDRINAIRERERKLGLKGATINTTIENAIRSYEALLDRLEEIDKELNDNEVEPQQQSKEMDKRV